MMSWHLRAISKETMAARARKKPADYLPWSEMLLSRKLRCWRDDWSQRPGSRGSANHEMRFFTNSSTGHISFVSSITPHVPFRCSMSSDICGMLFWKRDALQHKG